LKAFRSKKITVAEDLSTVTQYNPADEVNPEVADMSRDDVDAIWAGVEKYYRTGVHPAITLCLRRRGKVVLNRAIGHARGNGPDDSPEALKTPIMPQTPVCQFSASKAVTALLIHLLAEKGAIHLTDPVSHYIPEFGACGKSDITIFQVLSHRSGFPVAPKGADPDLLFDFDGVVQMICKSEPKYPAGHKLSYHAVTGGFILGEIIRRVTGDDIRTFVNDTIRKPLGFKYFNFGMPVDEQDTAASNYTTGPPVVFPLSSLITRSLGKEWNEIVRISNKSKFLQAIIPAGNLYATADEVSQFFQLLLNGGELNGVRIFDPLTVRRATIAAGRMEFDKTMVLLPMRYSPGLMLGSDPISLFGPYTKEAFGHWGFFNSFSWADPERDIAISLLTTGKALLGPHLIAHFQLLNRISKHCTKVNGSRFGSSPPLIH
jgi:CubicO group peptidase (beta-lactamase class C family)